MLTARDRNKAIVAAYVAGETVASLRQRYGLSSALIYHVLRKKGVIEQRKTERNRQIIAAHQAGVTAAALAQRHGLTRHRVYGILRASDVPPMPIRPRVKSKSLSRESLVTALRRLQTIDAALASSEGLNIPTLAEACGVSRKAIERDLAVVRAMGHATHHRRDPASGTYTQHYVDPSRVMFTRTKSH
jgi:Mor family transcriptional regulator